MLIVDRTHNDQSWTYYLDDLKALTTIPLSFIIVGQVLTNLCYANKDIRGLSIEVVEVMMITYLFIIFLSDYPAAPPVYTIAAL